MTKTRDPKESPFKNTLREAARVAESEFRTATKIQKAAKVSFQKFDSSLAKAEALIDNLRFCAPELKDGLHSIAIERRQELQHEWLEWERRFAFRRKDLSRFTIMLFGRTMTGKSTTFEALTEGDGLGIGTGAPDFTTDIGGRDWNGLHVIDTPGLEGFKPELQKIAEGYIDRADAILMVVSDDHIEPAILEKMAAIYTQNKPIAILLNIKGRTDRLLANPNQIFREHEIDGHKRRIRSYLKEFLGFDNIPIIPYNASAAFEAVLESDPKRRSELIRLSRFDNIQELIIQLIKDYGIAIRARSAYDSLMHHFELIDDDLDERLRILRCQAKVLDYNIKKSRVTFDQIHQRNASTLSTLKKHFYSVNERIHDFAEEAVSGKYEDPKEAFLKLLDLKKIDRKVQDLKAKIVDDIRREMERIQHEVKFDLSLVVTQEIEKPNVKISLDGLKWARVRKNVGKIGRVAGAPVAAALAGYAVFNWWNPTGWAVAAAVVVSAVGGYAVDLGVKKISKSIEESGKSDIAKATAKMRESLKKSTWDAYGAINKKSYKWLCDVIENAKFGVLGSLTTVVNDANAFIDAGQSFQDDLEKYRFEASLKAVEAIMKITYPKEVLDQFTIVSAPRRLGYRMKVVFQPKTEKSVLALLIGVNGLYIRKLESNCGSLRIDLVEVFEGQGVDVHLITSALRPANIELQNIRIIERDQQKLEVIVEASNSAIAKVMGRRRWNIRLAEAALGCQIRVNRAA